MAGSAGVVVLYAALVHCPSSPPPPVDEENLPMQGDWETVVDGVRFVHDEQQAQALGIEPVRFLGIGKIWGDNLVNRGHVEVVFADDHVGDSTRGFIDAPKITVMVRKFTTATSIEARDANLAKTNLYAYTAAPSDSSPTEDLSEEYCVRNSEQLDADGAPIEYWAEGCFLTVWYDGLFQPLRDGADIRVFVPADWRGHLDIATSDNIQDAVTYPRRSDVTLIDLFGSADVLLQSGESRVRLARGFDEVLGCDPAGHEACRDARWNTTDAGSCIDADGIDDDGHCSAVDECAADSECMLDECFCDPENFAEIRIAADEHGSANVILDVPDERWINAHLVPERGAVDADGDLLCAPDVRCGDFALCDHDVVRSDDRLVDRVELYDIGDDNIEGDGARIEAVPGDCAEILVAHGPADAGSPTTALRGQLTLCSGCLDEMQLSP